MQNKIKRNTAVGVACLALAGTLTLFQNCGGNGGGGNGGIALGAPNLSVSLSKMNLKVSGAARTLTVTNNGGQTATSVTYSTDVALPAGTAIAPSDCGDIAAGATCTLTLTPGAAASAAPGDTSATPIVLTLSSTNANALTVDINVVDYGSVVQGGYLFFIDDTVAPEKSIVGRVIATANQASPIILWSATNDNIDETLANRTAPCLSNQDGKCNSEYIWNFYSSVNPDSYAAGKCKATVNGYSDWYLPAPCEFNYAYNIPTGVNCGTQAAPLMDNMQSRLVENGNIGDLGGPVGGGLNNYGYRSYWTSVSTNTNQAIMAFMNGPSGSANGGAVSIVAATKNANTNYVRCARHLN